MGRSHYDQPDGGADVPSRDSEQRVIRRLTVRTPAAFDFRSTLLSHGWLQLLPFEHDADLSVLRRVERLRDGRIVELAFSRGEAGGIDVAVRGTGRNLDEAEVYEIRAITRRIFNLDVDLEPFYQLLEGEERYAWVRRHGAGRLLRSPSVWEDLAKTLLTTNTTWGMTRRMVERLTELGDEVVSGERGVGSGRTFPAPEQVAALPFDVFADQVRAGYRAAYLHEIAREVAAGRIRAEEWASDERSAETLHADVRRLKGFGPYAAGALLKLLGRYDYLAIDSSVRSTYARTFNDGMPADDAAIRRHYERYSPWRGLVVWLDLMHDWITARGAAGTPG